MSIERGVLRPPSEAESILLRVVRNCPWNRCRFCPAYKGMMFSFRGEEEIREDIVRIAADPASKGRDSLFLQDADALALPIRTLAAVLEDIARFLPRVTRITSYARVSTLVARPSADLRLLRSLGLQRIHLGFESGSDEVLASMDKGVTADRQIRAGAKAREAGFALSCYFMPGLGGIRHSEVHARESAAVLRRIEPEYIRLRTCFVLEDTPLADDYREGRFEPLSEARTVEEIRRFIEGLEPVRSEIVSDHRMNLLSELRGRLPEARDSLLGTLDRYLDLSPSDKARFEAGRRTGRIKTLDDLEDPSFREALDEAEKRYRPVYPAPRSVLFPKRDAASLRPPPGDARANPCAPRGRRIGCRVS